VTIAAGHEKSREELIQYVNIALPKWTKYTRSWSVLHHAAITLTAILGAAAVLVLQLKSINWSANTKADLASVLAAAGATLGAISGSGGLKKKWQTNRLRRSKLEQASLELTDPDCDVNKIREGLVAMIQVHDFNITAAEGTR
jgi:hypothetical protein